MYVCANWIRPFLLLRRWENSRLEKKVDTAVASWCPVAARSTWCRVILRFSAVIRQSLTARQHLPPPPALCDVRTSVYSGVKLEVVFFFFKSKTVILLRYASLELPLTFWPLENVHSSYFSFWLLDLIVKIHREWGKNSTMSFSLTAFSKYFIWRWAEFLFLYRFFKELFQSLPPAADEFLATKCRDEPQ